MKLWTIQPYCVYELMQKEGVYRCEPKKVNSYKNGVDLQMHMIGFLNKWKKELEIHLKE